MRMVEKVKRAPRVHDCKELVVKAVEADEEEVLLTVV